LQIEEARKEGRKEGIMCSLKLEVKGITKIRACVRVVAQLISVMPLTAGFLPSVRICQNFPLMVGKFDMQIFQGATPKLLSLLGNCEAHSKIVKPTPSHVCNH